MFRHNLKLIFRRILQEKESFFINLLGLIIGITAFLILFLYVCNEISFDRHIPNHENIYRVHTIPEGGEIAPWARSLGFVLPASLTFPEVAEVTQFAHSPEGTAKAGEQSFKLNDVLTVDTGFFRVFSIEMVSGDYSEILKPDVVFISEDFANKYFKGEDPVGKRFELEDLQYDDKAGVFEIRGIVENMHPKTHFRYDILTSQKGALQNRFESLKESHSRLQYAYHYVQLRKNSDLTTLVDKYMAYFEANCDVSHSHHLVSSKYKVDLLPITKIHQNSDYSYELKGNSNKINIALFILISLVILFISLFNFMNLNIVSIIKRSKEFGLVRFIGANSWQLTKQIIIGIILKSLLAIGISLVLIEILKPVIYSFFKVDFNIFYSEPVIYLSIIGIEFLIIVLSAGFTGFYILRKNSATDFLLSRNHFTGNPILKTLLVFQVIIVVFLLSSILLVNKQINYVLNQPLGFDKENVLVIQRKNFTKDPTVFANELSKQSQIVSVGFTSQHFGYPTLSESLEGFGLNGNIEYAHCDFNYIRTMDIKLKENWIDDSTNITSGIIINDHFYRQLIEKFGSIESYRIFQKNQEFNYNHILSQIRIVGVVNDFNYSSAHFPIGNFAFLLGNPKNFSRFIHVRLAKSDLRVAMKKAEEIWNIHFKGQPFNYFFIDDKIEEQYKAETILRRILLIFSLVGTMICIIGITAFSLFLSQQRTKEIGIRKVNGAKVSEILVMLNKDFVKWVAIAFVIATPIAFYAMNKWLENFAYKTNLSWWIFVLAGVLTLVIALVTVSWQSWRAATRNPVEALRYE